MNIDRDDVFIPDQKRNGIGFECPECGNQIKPPFGGHIYTCQPAYGGCGASFKPIEAFLEVNNGDV